MQARLSPTGGWSALLADFSARRLPATLATGLVLSTVNALLSVALMSLIFTGELKDALPLGIGVGLAASGVLGLVIALLSGFPGMYAGIQDSSAAILALAGASIATSVVGPDGLVTVLAMIVTTSLVTGTVLLLMGTFGLGDIARFVPFPVIGGLLAGTGYLILTGSIGILGVGSLADLMSVDSLGLLWPGLALAVLFFVASRRGWPSRTYLRLLVGGIVGFHIITAVGGVDIGTSLASGWLLGPLPDGSLWQGLALVEIGDADWRTVAGETPSLLTIVLIAPITLLLYLSALQIETKRELDVNAELRATGWANLAAGLVGGPPGYFYMSDTAITHRLIGGRRGPAVVAALGLLGIVTIGSSLLELLPQFVIGGLLLFVGISFLHEWLWLSRRRMTRLDYVLMVGIVLIIAAVGFLPGVAAGLVAAIVLFVYRYSRIDVVKHSLTAREHQSNIERPVEHTEYLHSQGDAVLILELQGYIFFGTANRIFDRVKSYVGATESLRYLVFDFRLVTGVDSSAVAVFERIAHLARDHQLTLVLTGLTGPIRAQFSELASIHHDLVEAQPDLDHGMAWCEDRLLEGMQTTDGQRRSLPPELAERLTRYLAVNTVPAGYPLMKQGEPTPGIFLITDGRASVLLEGDDGEQVRLRTLLEGTVVGEISLYTGEPCTATVVTDTECEVRHLTPKAFDDLCRNDPAAAADLHAFVARTLASRVSHANRAIRALQS